MHKYTRISGFAALGVLIGCNSTTGGTSSDNFLESTTQTSATARVNDPSKAINFVTASGDASLSVPGGTIPRASKVSVSQKKRADFSSSDQATLASILGTSASTELETSQADLSAGGGGTTSGFRVRTTGAAVTFTVKMRAGAVTAGFPCTAGNGFLSQIVGTTATTLATGTSVTISAVKTDATGQYQEFTGSSTSMNWQPTRFILSFSCSVVAAPSPSPSPTASPTTAPTIFTNGNIAAVSNSPTSPTVFTTTKAYTIKTIQTYHWNNAQGTTATGTISLKAADGTTYGPFSTTGTAGQGGVPNAYWNATPNIVLAAGTYTVLDSDTATWAQNSGSGGSGMVTITGF